MHDFAKEAEHLEGFAPELFQINTKTNIQYGLRPTSEIHFCHYFKNILNTYNQLPLKINQWANVFRAEKNTKVFLRSSEFFWHELHTIHANQKEAHQNALTIFELYQKFFNDVLNIAFVAGPKTINERFAGAKQTWTLETLMPDGQMLQSCTSHDLGDNFSKAFDIKITDANNQKQFCYQSSAGLSTRVIGALIMVHGDDYGMVLPFKLAKYQIALLTLLDQQTPETLTYLEKIKMQLQSYRYCVDDSQKSFGYKIQNQEIIGTPFSVIVGKQELQNNQVLIYNRLTRAKTLINLNEISTHLQQTTQDYQTQMLYNSQQYLINNIVECHT